MVYSWRCPTEERGIWWWVVGRVDFSQSVAKIISAVLCSRTIVSLHRQIHFAPDNHPSKDSWSLFRHSSPPGFSKAGLCPSQTGRVVRRKVSGQFEFLFARCFVVVTAAYSASLARRASAPTGVAI